MNTEGYLDIFHEMAAPALGGDAVKFVDAAGAKLASAQGLAPIPCPRMPIRLIEQVASGAEALPGSPWGIDAIGASLCDLKGEGICVAVLDSGIDRTHPAFKSLLGRTTTRISQAPISRINLGMAPIALGSSSGATSTACGSASHPASAMC